MVVYEWFPNKAVTEDINFLVFGRVVAYGRWSPKGDGCTWRLDCIQVALEGEVNSGRYIAKREASRYIII